MTSTDQEQLPITITIAWIDNTGLRNTGETELRDGQLRWRMESAPRAKAVVWLLEGTEADKAKAQAHADEEHGDKLHYAVHTWFYHPDFDYLQLSREAIANDYNQNVRGKDQ